MAKPMLKPTPSLADRIEQTCAEAEAYIDERAAVLKLGHPDQPVQVLRLDLTKHDHCACRVALRLMRE